MTTRNSSGGGGRSASSSVSSGSTITGIPAPAQIRVEERPSSTRRSLDRSTSSHGQQHPTPSSSAYPHAQDPNAFENLNPGDVGDIINNVENVEGRTTVTIKTHGTPPPAYASLSRVPPPSGSDDPYSLPSSSSPYPYVPHSHPEFGPTPLTAQHPLLAVPYHAYEYIGTPGAPDRRARWRFAGGLFWAVVILTLLGSLGSLGAVGEWGGGGDWWRAVR